MWRAAIWLVPRRTTTVTATKPELSMSRPQRGRPDITADQSVDEHLADRNCPGDAGCWRQPTLTPFSASMIDSSGTPDRAPVWRWPAGARCRTGITLRGRTLCRGTATAGIGAPETCTRALLIGDHPAPIFDRASMMTSLLAARDQRRGQDDQVVGGDGDAGGARCGTCATTLTAGLPRW